MKPPQSSQGLTLLELMVKLAIVAILATLAAPSLQNMAVRNNTATIANQFTGGVQRARSTAINRNMCTVMCRSDDTNANTPVCAPNKGNWNSGWLIFLNRGCDTTVLAPALDQVIEVTNTSRPEYSLLSNEVSTPATTDREDYIVFSPTGTIREPFAKGYDLQYRTESRASNRRICLNALGQVVTIDFQGTCP